MLELKASKVVYVIMKQCYLKSKINLKVHIFPSLFAKSIFS